jgi:hypothetical protein
MIDEKPKKEWFIAMIPNYWGRGNTIEEAKRNLRHVSSRRGVKCTVVKLPENAADPYVNQMGDICWRWTAIPKLPTPECEKVWEGKL